MVPTRAVDFLLVAPKPARLKIPAHVPPHPSARFAILSSAIFLHRESWGCTSARRETRIKNRFRHVLVIVCFFVSLKMDLYLAAAMETSLDQIRSDRSDQIKSDQRLLQKDSSHFLFSLFFFLKVFPVHHFLRCFGLVLLFSKLSLSWCDVVQHGRSCEDPSRR